MEKVKRARIQDVAELAGVSNMTVSRVLNGGVKVSEVKRKAVMNAVERLNYSPDAAARRLASKKSYMIGLLYQDLDISYVSKFLLRALKSCRNVDHHLVPDGIDGDIDEFYRAVKKLIDVTQIDGVILLAPISNNPQILELLQNAQIPFVRISPDDHSNISPLIAIDEFKAGYAMTEYLISLGHTKIAHIKGHPNQAASRLREEGFEAAMQANNLKIRPEYIVQGYYTYDSGIPASNALLAGDDRPTAIFAANDEMAAAAISVANKLGIKTPQQLSVGGLDDAQLAVTMSPHLTTIRQPIMEMAELAVDLLTSNMMQTNKLLARGHRHILDFELVKRQSATYPEINISTNK